MGDPVTIGLTLAALQVAKGGLGYMSEMKQSKTVQGNAQAAYDSDVAQQRSATIDQMNKTAREALQKRGAARVQGAEQGISISSLMQDLSMQSSTSLATLNENYTNSLETARIKAQSAMNQAPRPSLVGTLLSTGTDAATAYFGAQK